MQKYKYSAIDINKKKFNGIFLAENDDELRQKLAEQNLYLISFKAVSDKPKSSFWSVSGKIKISDLATFCRQFAIMINSGISIINCVEILAEQQRKGDFFKTVLESVHEDINSGSQLSAAMQKHKKVFPEFFCSMVYVGELSGSLDKVLVNIADYYENDNRIKKKIKGALMYPIMIMVLMIGVVVMMLTYIIPTFNKALAQLDVDSPLITQIIVQISQGFIQNWRTIAGITLIVIALFLLFRKSAKGRLILDSIKIKLPLLGKVQTNMVTARFARSFGLLLESGMDIVDAMDVMSHVLGNKKVEEDFVKVTNDVKQGMTLTAALTKHKMFVTMLIQMVSVGEKTGSIDEVLRRSCGYFDEQVETSMMSMTSLIQPVMLIIMGGVIGIMFYAIYAPMLQIMTNLI